MALIDDMLAAGGYRVDPRTSPFFGPQDMGSGSGTVGSGSPLGWMTGLENLPGSSSWFTPGYGEQDPVANREAFMQYLDQNGYQLLERPLPGGDVERAVLDRNGQPVLAPQRVSTEDKAFWNAALAAIAITTGNVGLANGLFSGGSAAATAAGAPAGASGAGATAGGSAAAGATAGTGGVVGGGMTAPAGFAMAPSLGPGVAAGGSAGAAAGSAGGLGVGGWMNAIGGGLSVAGGLYGMAKAKDAAEAMDPFGPYRGQYAQRLQTLEANPGMVAQLPGFQAGIKALESSTAASGYFGSGNAAAALTEFGGNFYERELARLAQLAGAGQSPGAGALGAAQLTGQSLAGIGYGIGQLSRLFPGG